MRNQEKTVMDKIKKEYSVLIKGYSTQPGYGDLVGHSRDCVIDSKETAIKVVIYLMFEWNINIQDFVDEYNKRVDIARLEKLDKEAKNV